MRRCALAQAAPCVAKAPRVQPAVVPRPVVEWAVGDVAALFGALKLGEHAGAILAHDVDGRTLLDLLAGTAPASRVCMCVCVHVCVRVCVRVCLCARARALV